jgi:hypothetical protein
MSSETFRFKACGLLFALCCFGAVLPPALAGAATTGTAARCVQVRNDDTVRPYEPSLRAGLMKAYARLFPGAQSPPPEDVLRDGSNIRCMNGRLYACFVGANLPCGKMNSARNNPGADEFCRTNANADVVPAFATGHDTIYSYRCQSGRPLITGRTFALDPRGFATQFWTPLE